MTVIATAGGCTQDSGEQPEEAVPIRLAATISPTDVGKTRAFGVWGGAATTQDTELLTGQTVRAWISENDGSHTDPIKDPIEYTVSNAAGDLEPVNTTTDPAFYYPQGVDVISIHAIHPSGYASGGTFTVNTDQTTEANYAASDLCYSMPANFARTDVDANGRKLLQMKHLLSKIVVNLTLDPNVTSATLPASIKLHAKTSTTMTYPVDPSIDANCYTGCTASDASNPGIITMIQEAIIPPQTIAAGASFLSFSVTGVGPMIYPMPAATTFESGKRYIYDISVKNVGIDVTTTVAGWGTDGVVRPPVRAQEAKYMKNPLWYVAEYNASDLAGTTMATTDNAGYFYSWSDAMVKFTADGVATAYDVYKIGGKTLTNGGLDTYHLPIKSEWLSIVPAQGTDNSLWTKSGYTSSSILVKFGYDDVTKQGVDDYSYWVKVSNYEMRAIRFLGTDYCSAWKYVCDGTGVMTIYATLIDKVNNNSSDASTWYTNHSWDGTGDKPIIYFGNDQSRLAVQRTFYPRGHSTEAHGTYPTADINQGWGYYQSASSYSQTNSWICGIGKNVQAGSGGRAYVYPGGLNYGFTVRLFRDN